MVERQLRGRDITDPKVLEAMGKVPRHYFVPEDSRNRAYADGPLRLQHGQTISQPYIVALMTQLLKLQGDETVLEIGTGSGYQAAILAALAQRVITIERIPELAAQAEQVFQSINLTNIEVHVGDGTRGYPEAAPYDGILVTAAAPKVPQPLMQQLALEGRLVIPVGSLGGQVLECWEWDGEEYHCEQVAPVAFVPLVGNHGWDPEQASRWCW